MNRQFYWVNNKLYARQHTPIGLSEETRYFGKLGYQENISTWAFIPSWNLRGLNEDVLTEIQDKIKMLKTAWV